MDVKDISHEEWREYWWECPVTGKEHLVRFDKVEGLVVGLTTHRVIHIDDDNGRVATIVPAPGYFGCTVTWKNPKDIDAVQF